MRFGNGYAIILSIAVSALNLQISAISRAAVNVYNLGTLGGTYSSGAAVSTSGQVAGESLTTTDAAYGAFRYDGTPGNGGIMRDLGSLGGSYPGSTNVQISSGKAINASGQVAGWSLITGNSATHAFRYDGTPGNGGVMRDLGTLGGTLSSFGYGINDVGQVTGSAYLADGSYHAFRYDGTPGSGGVMRDLGTFGGVYSEGHAVNASGQVAGQSQTTIGNTRYHAFRYDGTPGSGGVMRDLGTEFSEFTSRGYGINGSGQVVGGVTVPDGSALGEHDFAFRYDGTPGQGGVLQQLNSLEFFETARAYAINEAGFAVGVSRIHVGFVRENRAAFWQPDGQVIDLNAWLDDLNPVAGAAWTLEEAQGISASGMIVGTGRYDDGATSGTRAFLLDASTLVPEPSGMLCGIGAISFCLSRTPFRPKRAAMKRFNLQL